MQHVITETPELAALVARIEAAEAIGLDTEFLRERTYRAELCLVQIATADLAACVDPLARPDLAPLGRLLSEGSAVKVMHASRQDLEVLHPAVGQVRPLFDTQVAAALTGLPVQIGYAELVRRALGRELAKSHTRTDWSRRPLSPEQIEYALDDVRYLLPLRDSLLEQLERLGRLGWLREELEALEGVQFLPAPDQAWLRIKGLRALDPERTRLARRLGAWRERRAMERNRPRGWILDDAMLREIVMRVPRSAEALAEIPDMPPNVVRHCADEILACIEAADVSHPPAAISARPRPDPSKAALVKQLATINQTVAASLELSPELLATRRDLEQLAEGRRDVPVLHGWRREVIGEKLLAAL